MEKNLKQLLLKDLCARLPYHPNIRVFNPDGFEGYQTGEFDTFLWPHHIEPFQMDRFETIKPYLRPMSSMTEEECKELGELPATIENVGETLPNAPYYIEVARPEQIDWLNVHHFDFRGLIEMGLALEAPEEMYKAE